jgi:Lrp/AsnC family leucine-responsive transcriptional regulator
MKLLDRFDVALLEQLQKDSRQTVQQLAEKIGLSSTPCWKRMKDLESSGVIRGYSALVDRDKVGLSLCVLAEVNLARHSEGDVRLFEQQVLECAQIVSCYSTTGNADYLLKVLVRDIKAYETFLHETAFKMAGVTHIRSSVVLNEIKSESKLPLEVPLVSAAVLKPRHLA